MNKMMILSVRVSETVDTHTDEYLLLSVPEQVDGNILGLLVNTHVIKNEGIGKLHEMLEGLNITIVEDLGKLPIINVNYDI